MLYPQGYFYPQGAFSQQSFQNPLYPQGAFGQQAFQSNPFQTSPSQGNLGNIPFANTPYGYPQQTQAGYSQHPAQQQAALQQHAIQQLLAHQLAAQQLGPQQLGPQQFGAQQQPFGTQQPSAMNAFPGLSNGAAQSGAWTQPGAWPPQQPSTEQINPALTPRHHLLQQLAQYHYLVAQQLAQLAAQQAVQGSITPYAGTPYAGQFIPGAGQFIPGQLGGNFAPGITMH